MAGVLCSAISREKDEITPTFFGVMLIGNAWAADAPKTVATETATGAPEPVPYELSSEKMLTDTLIFLLLMLGRLAAKQGAASLDQVHAGLIMGFIDEEIFLLRPGKGGDRQFGIHTEQFEYPLGLFVEGVDLFFTIKYSA